MIEKIEAHIERLEHEGSTVTLVLNKLFPILEEKRVFFKFKLDGQEFEQRIKEHGTELINGSERSFIKLEIVASSLTDNMENGKFPVTLFTYGLLPSVSERVKAAIGDTFFIILMMFLVSAVFNELSEVKTSWRIAAFIGIWGIYEPLCVSLFGCTIGHRIIGIHVTKEIDPLQRLSFASSLGRYLIKLFAGWISLLSVEVSAKKQALHDKATGALVLYRTQ